MIDGRFGAKYTVSRWDVINDPFYFEYIKRELIHRCGEYLLPQIVDSDKFHVVKLNMYRDDNPDSIDFYLRGVHQLAQEVNVRIPVIDNVVLPPTVRECCQWCGNVLSLDERGGCGACGGWPKNG